MTQAPVHRLTLIILAFAALAGLARCSPSSMTPPPRPPSGQVVEPVVLSYAARFAPGAAKLSPPETAHLRSFIAHVRLDETATVHLSAGGELADARRRALLELLSPTGAAVTTEEGAPRDDQVLITVESWAVIPEACFAPVNWIDDGLVPAGCATALSLVREVERPQDLFQGREMGPADAASLARAAQRYQQHELESAASEAPRSGATYSGSDVSSALTSPSVLSPSSGSPATAGPVSPAR